MSYADEHFNTTDAVAVKLLEYSVVLARTGNSDVVRIPVVASGSSTWANLVLGPGSQITTLDVNQNETELDDTDVLQELDAKMTRLAHTGSPIVPESDPLSRDDDQYSDL
ncbi:MAG: hypothetical protein JWR33_1544 [Naasia sp.]|nr:hypothetical protein [Naasia sp.]